MNDKERIARLEAQIEFLRKEASLWRWLECHVYDIETRLSGAGMSRSFSTAEVSLRFFVEIGEVREMGQYPGGSNSVTDVVEFLKNNEHIAHRAEYLMTMPWEMPPYKENSNG